MAYCSIKPIDTSVKKSVSYILQEMKVHSDLVGFELIEYSNVDPDNIFKSFKDMKDVLHNSNIKREGYFAIQSFSKDELDKNNRDDVILAYNIGIKLAEEFLGEDYQYVLATHIDKDHIHNHIIFNSINITTGKAYKDTYSDMKRFQEISNKLCRENNLSTMEFSLFNGLKNKNKENQNEFTKEDYIEEKIYLNSKIAKNFDEFISFMKNDDIDIKKTKNDLAFKLNNQKQYKNFINNKKYKYDELKKYIESKDLEKRLIDKIEKENIINRLNLEKKIDSIILESETFDDFLHSLKKINIDVNYKDEELVFIDIEDNKKIEFSKEYVIEEVKTKIFNNNKKQFVPNFDSYSFEDKRRSVESSINSIILNSKNIDDFKVKLNEIDLDFIFKNNNFTFSKKNGDPISFGKKTFNKKSIEELIKYNIKLFNIESLSNTPITEEIKTAIYKNMVISKNFDEFREKMLDDGIKINEERKYLRFFHLERSKKPLRIRTNKKYLYKDTISDEIKKINDNEEYKLDFIKEFIKSEYKKDQMLGSKISKKDFEILKDLYSKNKKLYNQSRSIKQSLNYKDIFRLYHRELGYIIDTKKGKSTQFEGYRKWAVKNNYLTGMRMYNIIRSKYNLNNQEDILSLYMDNELNLRKLYNQNEKNYSKIKKYKKELTRYNKIKGNISIERKIFLLNSMNEIQEEINNTQLEINKIKETNVELKLIYQKIDEWYERKPRFDKQLELEKEKQKEIAREERRKKNSK